MPHVASPTHHRTSASTQNAVSEGAAAANRYLDEIQRQAKEVLRANAPPEQQSASWFGAALSSLDAFVSAGEEEGCGCRGGDPPVHVNMYVWGGMGDGVPGSDAFVSAGQEAGLPVKWV